jgi:hypothetical protein
MSGMNSPETAPAKSDFDAAREGPFISVESPPIEVPRPFIEQVKAKAAISVKLAGWALTLSGGNLANVSASAGNSGRWFG